MYINIVEKLDSSNRTLQHSYLVKIFFDIVDNYMILSYNTFIHILHLKDYILII